MVDKVITKNKGANNVIDNINISDVSSVVISQVLSKSYEYNDLLDQLNTQQKLFNRIPEDETTERIIVSQKINDLTNLIEQFKNDVLALAKTFQQIEIDTERLQRAKEYFNLGEIDEARAILEVELEKMQDEQKFLLAERRRFETGILPKLAHNSNEFLMLALSTQGSSPNNPNYYTDTVKYFEYSIRSFPTKENVFLFANFLAEHNQLEKAENYYYQCLNDFALSLTDSDKADTLNNLANLHRKQNNYELALMEFKEALEIGIKLAEINPETYLPDVARTLNNLAILHKDQNNHELALKEFNEALKIRRKLAETNPNTYLPDVATTLNNLANLHSDLNMFNKALKEFNEALKIRRKLAEINSNIYLSDIAETLNNLAILHSDQKNYEDSYKEYEEALTIYRNLAKTKPHIYLPEIATALHNLGTLLQKQNKFEEALVHYEESLNIRQHLAETLPSLYLPDIAMTLNNLASLYTYQHKFEEAKQNFEKSIEIYRKLVKEDQQTYSPYLAGNLVNLALFYQREIKKRKKSIDYAISAMIILYPLIEKIPNFQNHFAIALNILRNWGLSDEKISQMIEEKIRGNEQNND